MASAANQADGLGRYIHTFLPGANPTLPTLLLLHRTGGGENDLVPMAKRVLPGAGLLALRGNVLEDGKPRFFRRVGKGNFDREDLRQQTLGLDLFLGAACQRYAIAPPVAFGHSNGANIAWSLMFAGSRGLSGAILLRPFLPYDPEHVADLTGFPCLVLSGRDDSLVTADRVNRLPDHCRNAGASLTHTMLDHATHDLVEADEAAAAQWLDHTPLMR